MDRDRYQRIKSILAHALELGAPQRARYLDEACAGDADLRRDVEELLEDTGQPTEHLAPVAGPSVESHAEEETPGGRIDRYELVDRLGEGGMGSVWRARQEEPVRREVALKLIKLGMDSRQILRRFEAERQMLACLDHPGIAKVFDGGVSRAGRPYFVMELVRGVAIDRFCREERLGLRERVGLFGEACRAIQHAHQKGIIHRDIKPSNILVTEIDGRAAPKIIDFGIAKATEDGIGPNTLRGAAGTLIGTPDFMSPEQAEGLADVDTRSDVYSLGVLLYLLLTDRLPFEPGSGGLVDVIRRIQESEPTRPSLRIRRDGTGRPGGLRHFDIPPDLDWIVMRCLEKDRSRRYGTADALARDIDRFLSDRPVEAAPPSLGYRARKLYRRHRAAVGGALLALLVFVLGAFGTAFGLLEATSANRQLAKAARTANREAARAREAEQVASRKAEEAALEARIAEAVNQFLNEDLLHAVAPSDQAGRGRDVSMREVLDAAAERIERAARPGGRFDGLPQVEASIRSTLGRTYSALGVTESARRQLARAVELYEELPDASPERALRAASDLAVTLASLGRYQEAEELHLKNLRRYTADIGPEHRSTLASLQRLANVYRSRGRLEDAARIYQEALETAERLYGESDPATISLIGGFAIVQAVAGRYREAEELFRRNLDLHQRYLGPEHPETLSAMNNLAAFLTSRGRRDEAEPLLLETLELQARIFGRDHPNTLATIQNLGILALEEGRYAEAEPWFSERLERLVRTQGPRHPDVLQTKMSLGEVLDGLGRHEEADRLLVEALEGCQRQLGRDHPQTLRTAKSYANHLFERDRLEEARPLLEEILAGEERVLGADHPNTLDSLINLARYHAGVGEHDRALELADTAIERSRRARGDDDKRTFELELERVALLEAAGHHQEALDQAERTAERVRFADGGGELLARALLRTGVNHGRLDRPEAARSALQEANRVAELHLREGHRLRREIDAELELIPK